SACGQRSARRRVTLPAPQPRSTIGPAAIPGTRASRSSAGRRRASANFRYCCGLQPPPLPDADVGPSRVLAEPFQERRVLAEREAVDPPLPLPVPALHLLGELHRIDDPPRGRLAVGEQVDRVDTEVLERQFERVADVGAAADRELRDPLAGLLPRLRLRLVQL